MQVYTGLSSLQRNLWASSEVNLPLLLFLFQIISARKDEQYLSKAKRQQMLLFNAETSSQCFFYSCTVAVEVGCKDPTAFKKRGEVLQS